MNRLPVSTSPLRSYELPKSGPILLACGKCQRKLKEEAGHELASFKKILKKAGKQVPKGERIRVLKVPCLKMCPKGGVTVVTPAQAAAGECSILRSKSDVATICRGLRGD